MLLDDGKGRNTTKHSQFRAWLVMPRCNLGWGDCQSKKRGREIEIESLSSSSPCQWSIMREGDGGTEKESDNRQRARRGLAVILGHHSNSDVWLVSAKWTRKSYLLWDRKRGRLRTERKKEREELWLSGLIIFSAQVTSWWASLWNSVIAGRRRWVCVEKGCVWHDEDMALHSDLDKCS